MDAEADLFDLTGKGAVITGSSRGIGLAIARAFAARGANVVISSRKAAACEEAAASINALGRGRAIPIAANIGDKEQVNSLMRDSVKALGRIDILVCNAASNPHYGPMSTISDEMFEKTLRNNVIANHWLCQIASQDMLPRGEGSIIIVGSFGGFRGSAVIGAYNLTKAADFQLARNLAVEWGEQGVRVNCIAPGLIKTDFSRALWADEANLSRALTGTPMKRIGTPEDVAGAAVFLAAPASRYVTGQTLLVDGGATVTAGGL